MINMPALGETVYAARGCGCFVDGRPARVSDRTRIAGSYLSSCGFDYWSDEMLAAARASGAAMRTWGDGYGYALVATGPDRRHVRSPRWPCWDVAPMPVILAEAGGRFTDLEAGSRAADLGVPAWPPTVTCTTSGSNGSAASPAADLPADRR